RTRRRQTSCGSGTPGASSASGAVGWVTRPPETANSIGWQSGIFRDTWRQERDPRADVFLADRSIERLLLALEAAELFDRAPLRLRVAFACGTLDQKSQF